MEWYHYFLIIGVGFLAGFINTLAGSGSLLTLPLLMFLGLPANVANGTNRIAILLQNIVAVKKFSSEKLLDYRHGWKIGLFAFAGSGIGAFLAVDLGDKMMNTVIAVLLVVMILLIIFRPGDWVKQKAGEVRGKSIAVQAIVFFFIGLYGGFIQAGVGFFLLAGLVLSAGYDLVKANALKLFIVLLYTPLALVVFMLNNQVDYKVGIILAVGNMAGAWIASRLAIKRGAEFIRWFLLLALLISALKLFGLF
jgi:hypothetical protein